MARTFRTLSAAAALLALSACTVHKQDATPALTGPSDSATSMTVTVSPDVLTQDGQSQSLVQVTAYGPNGQPARNLPLRAEISVGNAVTDFGTLSARNIVTDANGRASVTYTAPPAPAFNIDTGTVVSIQFTPTNTGDAANANTRVATIRLVPAGTVGTPRSSLTPDFVAPTATVGSTALFQATVKDANGADATGQVGTYQWNFGDGSSASGQNVSHSFATAGSYPVTLTITDLLGRSNTASHSISIGQGQVPTAAILFSPTSPVIDQQVNFTGSGSTVEPGHRINSYAWNFGDGGTAFGETVQHAYGNAGTYQVTLQVTDEVGRKSTLASQSVTVSNGNPTPEFTFNPSAPKSGQQVVFDASATQAASGRNIVSYSWAFGDGGSGTGQTVPHTFTAVGGVATTYNVLLTVTDSSGKTSSVTHAITVNP